jgi:hypothetical protein
VGGESSNLEESEECELIRLRRSFATFLIQFHSIQIKVKPKKESKVKIISTILN